MCCILLLYITEEMTTYNDTICWHRRILYKNKFNSLFYPSGNFFALGERQKDTCFPEYYYLGMNCHFYLKA